MNVNDCMVNVVDESFFSYLGGLANKNVAAKVAQLSEEQKSALKQYGYEYFETTLGYGGYHYDGRQEQGVMKMIAHYGLKVGDTVLDVGCAKGFFLMEFFNKGFGVGGIDISSYAIEHSHPEIKPYLKAGSAAKLDWPGNSFDLIISFSTLHNLSGKDLDDAILEIRRCSKKHVYLEIASFRNDAEYQILKTRGVTIQTFLSPEQWVKKIEALGLSCDVYFKTFQS